MVEFVDGSIKAQLGTPDMRLPILYAFSYPNRFCYNQIKTNFAKIGSLTFLDPDFKKFECLSLAYECARIGGLAPCILNAANEIAVDKFLKGKIKFLDIPEIIKIALDKIENKQSPSLEEIFECDRKTRSYLNQKLFKTE
jgi:1-deoxy-D-xylulose-5-phosphate reductoisomerase